MENEQVYGPLAERVRKVHKLYKTLVDFELEYEDIREKGNIIAHEKQALMQDDSTLSQEWVEKIRNELEIWKLMLNDTCSMV